MSRSTVGQLGLAFLGAAIVGGRDGGHGATACALTGGGAAVLFARAAQPDLDTSGLYLTGAGLRAVAGLLLQRAGVSVDPMGLAVTSTGGGLVLALTTQAPDVLADATTWAIALGLVALVNLVLALVSRRPRATATDAAPEQDTDREGEIPRDPATA